MQSIEPRGFAVPRIGIALFIAIAALMIGILSTGILIATDRDSDTGVTSITNSPQERTKNTGTLAPAPQSAAVDGQDLSPLTPGSARPSVRSYEDIRFLEMNLDLPAPEQPEPRSFEEIHLWEINMLPGDHAPYFPVPNEHQSTNPEVNF